MLLTTETSAVRSGDVTAVATTAPVKEGLVRDCAILVTALKGQQADGIASSGGSSHPLTPVLDRLATAVRENETAIAAALEANQTLQAMIVSTLSQQRTTARPYKSPVNPGSSQAGAGGRHAIFAQNI
ncbi:hypothetical protein M5E06_32120 [Azospirillum sp. A1-3]|uniref:hypothetical protein n=1 Tax=Azospirillum sp. A1-3 TaxID=185874 RepID=UPI0020778126|nr:hypothetical protein [Azospirillum sp. A1-3]MCM8738747.1 hypothetical protein [Azospirillum sp. A1-3]